MEVVGATWIGVTCWQIMTVWKATSKGKLNLLYTREWLFIFIILLPCSSRNVASEHLMGGHGRRRTCSASWTRYPHAWEIVLPVTQKVQNIFCMKWLVDSLCLFLVTLMDSFSAVQEVSLLSLTNTTSVYSLATPLLYSDKGLTQHPRSQSPT